jgi:hypothetical protein
MDTSFMDDSPLAVRAKLEPRPGGLPAQEARPAAYPGPAAISEVISKRA